MILVFTLIYFNYSSDVGVGFEVKHLVTKR